MKIYLLDEVLEYKNEEEIVDNLFKEIDEKILEADLVFSHLIIDDYEVYNDFYDYFLDNVKNIEEVKVVVKSEKEISQEIILSTLDYLDRAVLEIEGLSNEFYKSPSENSWVKVMDLIEGIKWIMDTFNILDGNKDIENIVSSYEKWNLYAKNIHQLEELLIEFEEILENNDFVSIADILSYEIIPLFEEMKETLGELILEEVDFK